MAKAGFTIGIIAIVALCIGYIPCFGWSFMFTLPLAVVGLVLSVVGLVSNDQAQMRYKNQATMGLIMNLITLILGFIRWVIGGFVL